MLQIQKDQSTSALRYIPFVAELSANRNEVQRLALNDFSTGDSFTLSLGAETTSTISYNASTSTVAASIKSALELLTAVDNVTVTNVSGQTYDVTFAGVQAAQTVSLLAINVISSSFTPTGVTRTVTGGVANSPAIGETFANNEILISKNGGALANSAGAVVEIGVGGYYYIPTAGEVDTQGFIYGVVQKSGLAVSPFVAQITAVGGTTETGTVIATGTAQGGDSNYITLASSASGLTSYYPPCQVDITSGTGALQGGRLGVAYNADTKNLTVEPPFVVTPDSTSVYKLTAVVPLVADAVRENHATAGTFGEVASVTDIVDEFMLRSDEFADDMFDLTDGIETSLTLRQALRLLVAASAGKLSGGATTTVTIRNFGDTKDRIVATVDADGNRTAITTDLT